MKIDRQKLYKLYIDKINQISEENLDWKTQFTPEEIVNLISGIIEENNDVYELKSLNDKYSVNIRLPEEKQIPKMFAGFPNQEYDEFMNTL